MKHKNSYHIKLALTAVFLVSLACGTSNEGTLITPAVQETEKTDAQSVNTVEPKETKQVEEPKSTFEVFEVGDLIEVEESNIRLNSVKYQGTQLAANFTIENLGSSDLNVSSMLSFSAKKDDGTRLEQDFFDCGGTSLDGSILPGDKLKGDICWSGASPDDKIKIYYESSLFGQGAVVWNAVEGVAEELSADSSESSQYKVFKVGDLVQGQDQTIRLNSLEYKGNVLVADYSIENIGNSDISVSSMMSFSAKKNDGTKLEQEIFDCGTSGLDGKILSGDRLRGTICWTGAKADDNLKIYYEADLFGEGAIVWEAIEGTAEPLVAPDAQLKVDVHDVGDIVQSEDQSITLNSVEFKGNVMKANFTVENKGSSDLNISSMLSFYARERDGSKLEQEYFDCGTSMDGSVIPGDKLKGDICWKGANPDDGISIYYEQDIFDSGAVVWLVK